MARASMIYSEQECFDLLQRPNNRARWERMHMPEPNSGCWLWLAAVGLSGHGQFFLADNRGKRGLIAAHRAGWMIHVGPIPAGLLVCHKCDNPGCVNPGHHFLGTHIDNSLDMVAKGRNFVPNTQGVNNPAARLTEVEVMHIRTSGLPYSVLAKQLGVSLASVQEAGVGASWSHLPGARPVKKRNVISADTQKAIRLSTETLHVVCERYGVSTTAVLRLRGPIHRPEAGRKVSAARLAKRAA